MTVARHILLAQKGIPGLRLTEYLKLHGGSRLRADGRTAAFGQPDGVVVVDLLTGVAKRYPVLRDGDKYAGHSEYIENVIWHPDGKTLFVAGRGAYLLDTQSGNVRPTLADRWDSIFTDAGELVALGLEGLVRYDLATGAKLPPPRARVPVSSYSRPISRGSRIVRGVWHEGWEAIAVADLGSGVVERLLSFKGLEQQRDTGCCPPLGWLDDDTVIIDSLYAARGINGLLAWDVRTGAVTRLTELSGSAAVSFARL